MKGIRFTLTVLVISCVLLLQTGCQQAGEVTEEAEPTLTKPETVSPTKAQPTKPRPEKSGPKITFEKEVYDFGEVSPGTKTVCEFNFTNTGSSLLTVTKVQPCCGIKAKLKDDKKDYAPGESGTVIITVSSTRYRGVLTKRINVSSNDKARPRIPLTIKGKFVAKVRHQPDKLKLLPNDENARCPNITLTSVDDQPFAIKSFRSPGDCITASFDPSVEATKFVLEPKVDLEKLKKSSRGSVTIGLTHPKCNMVTVRFDVLPRFSITPSSTVVARNAEPQKPIKKTVWVQNNYGEDFEIEPTSSDKGTVKVLSRKKTGNRYTLELEIMPPVPQGSRRTFSDVLHVNIEGGEKLRINCNGFYAKKKREPTKPAEPAKR